MSDSLPPLAVLDAVAWPEVEIARVEALVLRDDSVEPVRGAFGAMRFRPGLLVRVTDRGGIAGYGEIWSNFPVGGAEYKATLIREYAAQLLVGRHLTRPSEGFDLLDRRLAALALQSGDLGAFAQLCAGIDQALWDLFCKRIGSPFWMLAGGAPTVDVYASGIGPDAVGDTIRGQTQSGHTRFKIKLGFGDDIDRRNIDAALAALPAGGVLLTDVNQAWSLADAQRWLAVLEPLGILWCEEPIAADSSCADWAGLAGSLTHLRLAAGENLRGLDALSRIARDGGVRVLQPDLGKWGGITGALRLHAMLGPDTWLCPHWLSGAVGQVASLQFAAVARSGWVEVDSNPNRLRTGLLQRPLAVHRGAVQLGDEPGLVPPMDGSLLRG
jgi:D-galactarolactone cycloisomerase